MPMAGTKPSSPVSNVGVGAGPSRHLPLAGPPRNLPQRGCATTTQARPLRRLHQRAPSSGRHDRMPYPGVSPTVEPPPALLKDTTAFESAMDPGSAIDQGYCASAKDSSGSPIASQAQRTRRCELSAANQTQRANQAQRTRRCGIRHGSRSAMDRRSQPCAPQALHGRCGVPPDAHECRGQASWWIRV